MYASFICAVCYHFCHDIIPVYNLYVHNGRIFTYTVNVSFLDNVLHNNKVYFTLKNVLSCAHLEHTDRTQRRLRVGVLFCPMSYTPIILANLIWLSELNGIKVMTKRFSVKPVQIASVNGKGINAESH